MWATLICCDYYGHDHGAHGRNKCVGYAYKKGDQQGLLRDETMILDLGS
jgi:hypothetical protein